MDPFSEEDVGEGDSGGEDSHSYSSGPGFGQGFFDNF
jgi:hypothetical protein